MRDVSTCLVVDLEATCEKGCPPPNPNSEIIEIGLSVVDMVNHKIVEDRSIIIRPLFSKVTPFCTELTGITPEEAEGGVAFKEACTILKKEYASRDRIWASFGGYDARGFHRDCDRLNLPYPFGLFHMDIKALFELKTQQMLPLTEALACVGLDFVGRAHRGVDDAHNTARLLLHLL